MVANATLAKPHVGGGMMIRCSLPRHALVLGILSVVLLIVGCGGDAEVDIRKPGPSGHGPVVSGVVWLPTAEFAQAPTVFDRVASVIVRRVEALTGTTVQEVPRNFVVQLLQVKPGDIVDGKIPAGLPVLAEATTDDDGVYQLALPLGTDASTCRFMVQVVRDSRGAPIPVTRAFVHQTNLALDISFRSEAAIRLMLETLSDSVALCDFNQKDIGDIVQSIADAPGEVSCPTVDVCNRNATDAARGDVWVKNAVDRGAGPTGSLATALRAQDEELTLVDATQFADSGKVQIDGELLTYTGRSGNRLTGLIRGVDGTDLAEHGPGAEVNYIIPTAATPTPTQVLTSTRTPTRTSPRTNTPTNTPTLSATRTPTLTPTITPTRTDTGTPTQTPTITNTGTPTDTRTNTGTPTITPTKTPTPTNTPPPRCGNSVVEPGEDCDNGMMCIAGSAIPIPPAACANDGDCGANGTCVVEARACYYSISCTTNAECGTGGKCAPVGGDGCAANCTNETAAQVTLNGATSGVRVNALLFQVPDLEFDGTQTVKVGKPSPLDVTDPSGNPLFKTGEIPIVTRADSVEFVPIDVLGIACACLRGHPYAAFGPGNSAMGVIGCSQSGLTDNNLAYSQDHRLFVVGDPKPSPTPGTYTIDDCTAAGGTMEPGGGVCTTGKCVGGIAGKDCTKDKDCNGFHPFVCNGPLIIQSSGGSAGRGSARWSTYQSNTQIRTGCDMTTCTVNDPVINPATLGVSTTGSVIGSVLHANATPTPAKSIGVGSQLACDKNDTNCVPGERCFDKASLDAGGTALCTKSSVSSLCTCRVTCKAGTAVVPCNVTAEGQGFNCDNLINNPATGLVGGMFVSSVPGLDTDTLSGDTVSVATYAPE